MEAVNLNPTPVPVQNVQPDAGIGSEAKDYLPLYDRYQASQGARTDRIFKEIWDYAKSVSEDSGDRDSVMWQISKLSNRLGSPAMGEKPWTKIHAWVTTYNSMRRAEDRMKQMEPTT